MATGDNPLIPLYEEGDRFTAAVTAAVTSGRFVKPSGNFQGGPLLDLTGPTTPLVKGNLPQVAQCVAGDRALGVAAWDAPNVDDVLPVINNGSGMIVPMVAGGTIVAGNKVMSDAAGQPVAWVSAASEANNSNGLALNGATVGQTVYVRLH